MSENELPGSSPAEEPTKTTEKAPTWEEYAASLEGRIADLDESLKLWKNTARSHAADLVKLVHPGGAPASEKARRNAYATLNDPESKVGP